MSIDEPETPRVYHSEGADAVDRCFAFYGRADIVDDDKVDVSRMAEDEVTAVKAKGSQAAEAIGKKFDVGVVVKVNGTVDGPSADDDAGAHKKVDADVGAAVPSGAALKQSTSNSTPRDEKGPPFSSASVVSTTAPLNLSAAPCSSAGRTATSAASPMFQSLTTPLTLNGLHFLSAAQQQQNEGAKTAFNPVNPGYIFHGYSATQQQVLHTLSQQYYNGLLFPGARMPIVAQSPVNGLAPSLLSPLHGLGVYSPNAWLSTSALDPSKPTLYAPTPLIVGWPISPTFMPQFDPNQYNAVLQNMSRMQQSPMFQPSPFQSPNTGALIVPLASKLPPAAPCPTVESSTATSLLQLGSALSNAINSRLLSTVPLSSTSASNYNVAGGPSSGDNAPTASPSMSSRPLPFHRPQPHPTSAKDDAEVNRGVCGAPSQSTTTASVSNVGNDGRRRRLKEAGRRADVDCCRLAPRDSSSTADDLILGRKDLRKNVGEQAPIAEPIQENSRQGSQKRPCLTDRNNLKASSSCKSTVDSKAHIKKPLNAFMLYMKEMRPVVMEEAGLKERQSAEINRILGKRWHSLTREDQQKFYEMARRVRQEHLQKYPGWSARDNYAINKKKKRKRDMGQDGIEPEAKKCRARFGFDQQAQWCKHCRRKKKCLWFKESESNDESTSALPRPAHPHSAGFGAGGTARASNCGDSDDDDSAASDDVAHSSTTDDDEVAGGDSTLTTNVDGDATPTSLISGYCNDKIYAGGTLYYGTDDGSVAVPSRTSRNAASTPTPLPAVRLVAGGTSLLAL